MCCMCMFDFVSKHCLSIYKQNWNGLCWFVWWAYMVLWHSFVLHIFFYLFVPRNTNKISHSLTHSIRGATCHLNRRHIMAVQCLVLMLSYYDCHSTGYPWLRHKQETLFLRYWPFVRGIHQSPVNSLPKASDAELSCFLLICSWLKGWVNNREAGDLRRHGSLWRHCNDYGVTWVIALDTIMASLGLNFMTWDNPGIHCEYSVG